MNNHTLIPPQELEVFKKLTNLKVIFDVGARDDTDYLRLKPKAICHLFEPNPVFFDQLRQNVQGNPRAILNRLGLGDKKTKLPYSPGLQTFDKSEAWDLKGAFCLLPKLQIDTLNNYCEEKGITSIDFLKIDTEGYDYKVLKGASNILSNIRFIQYEHWDYKQEFHDLLEPLGFHLEYIGYRNVLCINKVLVSQKTRGKLIKFIRDNEFSELV